MLSFCSVAALPTEDEFLARLEKNLVAVQTMQSDFRMIREMPALGMTLEFTGKLAYDGPARKLLWRIESPLSCAFRVQDDELAQWDEETGKTLVIPATKLPWLKLVREELGKWLSGDLSALRKSAEVQVVAEYSLRLTPKSGVLANFAQGVEIEFSEDDTQVAQIHIVERDGALLTIRFQNSRLNQPISPDVWGFAN